MASTPDLDVLLDLSTRHGAAVRLQGDPTRSQAVVAGGALRLIDSHVGAAHLEHVNRSLPRGGRGVSSSAGRGQGRVGTSSTAGRSAAPGGDGREVCAGWWNDTADGAVSVMIAATNDDVVALSARARLDRVAVGLVEHDGGELHDEAIVEHGAFPSVHAD